MLTTTITYDATGQVVDTTDTVGNQSTYTYDRAGNRTRNVSTAVRLPIAAADAISTPINTPVTFAPLANDSDPDGRALTVTAADGASHGSVSFTGSTITYTPVTDYYGSDELTYTVFNGRLSAKAKVTISVVRPAAPTAGDVSFSTAYNTASSTPLSVSGSYTSLAISTPPTHGAASLNGANATYTPAVGFYGSDAFSYVATGVGGASAPGKVSVSVGLPPAPIASPANLAVSYGVTGSAPLAPSGVYTSLAVVSPPAHGAVTINDALASFTPAVGYYGPDQFSYSATGPGGVSAPALVSVQVATPDAPTVGAVSTTTPYNVAKTIPLLPDGVYTGLSIVNAPAHGAAAIVASSTAATYQSASNYYGPDSFSYRATGPGGDSNTATVSIVVGNPPAPTVGDTALSTGYNTSGSTILNGSGIITSYAIGSAPAHGSASIAGNTVSYTPSTGYYGADTATYTATGPGGSSSVGTLHITVSTPSAPTAAPVGLTVGYGAGGTGGLAPAGVYTSLAIATAPAHGVASITGTTLSYTPAAGYYGPDSLSYTATGPGGTSTPATVSITVGGPPAPVANAVSFSVPFGQGGFGGLAPGGVYTSLSLASAPAHGSVTISGLNAIYTPGEDFFGGDSFTYVASGPGGTSAPATAFVTVLNPPYPAGTVLTPVMSGRNFSLTIPVGALHHVQVTCKGGDGGSSSLYSGGAGGTSIINVAVTPGVTVISGTLGSGGSSGSAGGTGGSTSTCSSSSSSPTFTMVDGGGLGAVKTRGGYGGSASGGTSNSTGSSGGGSGRSGSVKVVVTSN